MVDGMIYWAQLLHMYQPPTQTYEVLKRVTEESYRPVLRVLHEHPNARIAININAVLSQLLAEHGFEDVLESLRELSERGQVELTGSGAFHPILPLIPQSARVRSITDNEAMNRRYLGESFRPTGFFPPEMCISDAALADIRATNHEWVIAGGVASPDGWPTVDVCRVDDGTPGGEELGILFRDDVRSNRISFAETTAAEFLDSLAASGVPGSYVVTAMDMETFGHHVKGWEDRFLVGIYARIEEESQGPSPRVQMLTPGEVVELMPVGKTVKPRPSSWSTSNDDLTKNDPYPLWKSPGNRIHEQQWQYVDHAIELVELANASACTEESEKEAKFALERLQPALHSCQFWWASHRPWWSVLIVHRGLLLLQEALLHAARSIELSCADDSQKEVVRWRIAAANDSREEIERLLLMEPET